MAGELFALLSAIFYGCAGVAISKGKEYAKGDNGVFLSVVVTGLLTAGLWLFWGVASLSDLGSWESMRGLGCFALAGLSATVLGRTTMYRSIELIGAVKAGVFRRLIPVFSLICGILLMGEWPRPRVIVGGAVIMLGVFCYQLLPRSAPRALTPRGDLLGLASAFLYAMAYSLRRLGLAEVPDPLFGTLLGSLVGLGWFVLAATISSTPVKAFRRLLCDRHPWHWATALSLGIGQTLQFLALNWAPASTVAVLGSLDLFFSAALIALFFKGERFNGWLLGGAGGLALMGLAILFS